MSFACLTVRMRMMECCMFEAQTPRHLSSDTTDFSVAQDIAPLLPLMDAMAASLTSCIGIDGRHMSHASIRIHECHLRDLCGGLSQHKDPANVLCDA